MQESHHAPAALREGRGRTRERRREEERSRAGRGCERAEHACGYDREESEGKSGGSERSVLPMDEEEWR
jgi:hypothetical protein